MLFLSKLNNRGLEACYEIINSELSKKDFYKYVRNYTENH